MPTIEEWYRGIPPVTRAWFTASFICSVLFSIGAPMTGYLPLDWDQVTSRFEVWRLLTCFIVFGGLSFNLIITYYMMYNALTHSFTSPSRYQAPPDPVSVSPPSRVCAGVSTCARWR